MEVQTKERLDLYQTVTNRVIALLEEGVAPWRKTWGSRGFAQNYETKNPYRGINFFMLNMVAPYSEPYYLSWKQIKKRGGKVIKGSKAEYVYFYKEYFKDESGKSYSEDKIEESGLNKDNLESVRFLKSYRVFNISCVEGIDFDIPETVVYENEQIEECEVFLNSLNPSPEIVSEDVFRAYYCPDADHINMPPFTAFETAENAYNSLYHEIIHWTGAKNRLKRFEQASEFGSVIYAEEELVAELGASYLCAYTEITRTPLLRNNVAYLASWIERLKGDKKLIFKAAAKAQKAAEFLIKQ